MTTAYPAALDAYGDPTGGQVQGLTTPTHSGHHTNHNDAIEAIEAKLGIGAGGPPASGAVLRRTATGSSGWGLVVSADIGVQTIQGGNVAPNTLVGGNMVPGTIDTTQLATDAATQAGFAMGIAGNPTTTSTSFSDLADMAVTLTTTGGNLLVWASITSYNSVLGNANAFAFSLDGAAEQGYQRYIAPGANYYMPVALVYRYTGVAAGSHTVKVRWTTSGGTATSNGQDRALLVMERKR